MTDRDHELNECEEIVESEGGYVTVRRCEACRKEMYSLTPRGEVEWRAPANEKTTLDRVVDLWREFK